MPSLVAGIGALSFAATVVACGSFATSGSTPSAVPADAAPADAAPADTPPDGVAPADAAPDGAGPCIALVHDSFDDPDASSRTWIVEGDASFVQGEAVLVPAVGSSAGAMWHPLDAPLDGGRLHVQFTSDITENPGNSADGLTFAWAPGTSIPPLGDTGGAFGFCGASTRGAALVVDSFQKDVTTRGPACSEPGTYKPSTVFGPIKVDAIIDGTSVVGTFAGLRFTLGVDAIANVGAVGFTAGTGLGYARHAVDDVNVEWCP